MPGTALKALTPKWTQDGCPMAINDMDGKGGTEMFSGMSEHKVQSRESKLGRELWFGRLPLYCEPLRLWGWGWGVEGRQSMGLLSPYPKALENPRALSGRLWRLRGLP